MASVHGKAARVMGSWKQTEANYIHAWNRLCDVYEDDYLTVQTLVRELLSIPKMKERTYDGLRKIIDTVHECTNQLKSFVRTKNWYPILVFMVIDLLDPITYNNWEEEREKNTKSTMDIDDTELR